MTAAVRGPRPVERDPRTAQILVPRPSRRRQDAVEPQVIRFLAVVIGPVADRNQDRGRLREGIGTEQLNRRGELRVVQFRQRRLAEAERLLQAGGELFLSGGGIDRGPLWDRNAGELAADLVVPFIGEMNLDFREAHLRRRGSIVVLLRRHRFGGGHQNARVALLLGTECICDRAGRRRRDGRRGLRGRRAGEHRDGEQESISTGLHHLLQKRGNWILSSIRRRRQSALPHNLLRYRQVFGPLSRRRDAPDEAACAIAAGWSRRSVDGYKLPTMAVRFLA